LSSILFISVTGLASEDESKIYSCQEQGNSFGDGRGVNYIKSECVDLFRERSSGAGNKKSTNEKTTLFGYRNILFIEQLKNDGIKKIQVIAGSSTLLEDIVAVAFDEKNREVAVLERSGDVLFFSSIITGNVAPYRIIKSPELLGATDLLIDTERDQVIILNNAKNSVLFFSRLGNAEAREGKKKLSLLRKIEDTSGLVMGILMDLKNKKLILLEKSGNAIFYQM